MASCGWCHHVNVTIEHVEKCRRHNPRWLAKQAQARAIRAAAEAESQRIFNEHKRGLLDLIVAAETVKAEPQWQTTTLTTHLKVDTRRDLIDVLVDFKKAIENTPGIRLDEAYYGDEDEHVL